MHTPKPDRPTRGKRERGMMFIGRGWWCCTGRGGAGDEGADAPHEEQRGAGGRGRGGQDGGG
eukprot:scaffold207745_cov21-Prasinocladus_malaysianus.AAC.1